MAATGPRSGPRAGKLFYGWVVVAASFTIVAVGYGLQFSYGVFLPYMMADLGLDLVAATAPFSLYVLIYSLMCFVSGPATDRFGPRMVVVTGGIMLALGYALLTTSTGNWQLYAYLSLVAGIGMSAVFVPLNATVVRWFIRRRGFALAVIGSGSNAALLFGPMLAALLIPWLGWRGGLLALSLLGGLIITACALALVRDPEARRLLPDGHGAEAPAERPRRAQRREGRCHCALGVGGSPQVARAQQQRLPEPRRAVSASSAVAPPAATRVSQPGPVAERVLRRARARERPVVRRHTAASSAQEHARGRRPTRRTGTSPRCAPDENMGVSDTGEHPGGFGATHARDTSGVHL